MDQQQEHETPTASWWSNIISFFRAQASSKNAAHPDNHSTLKDTLVSRILPEDYEALYANLGYRFQNNALLRQALTHRSFMNESGHPDIEDNERMEFFGDSVLGFVICNFLYQHFPQYDEGDLSRIKSHVVSEPFLAVIARELELGTYLLLGKGEAASGGHEKNSLLSDCYEAVVASIYLDGGIEPAREFLLRCFQEKIVTLVEKQHILDHKSLFQERAQEIFRCTPRYKLREIIGPDHDKTFEVDVFIKHEIFSVGTGKNRKEAEQSAAKAALAKLNIRTGKVK
ncbi:ribonuclease III [candidate division KSB3 bacterium]|uniref:Ribonuclease 3 n=1 Tax=candidate division KSB3 bacterium TaxID=2044937 RepID=A0A2G6KGE9_9BACT|nr:MAG: ribonuclease III [candidate division KSB3 bacterium]